MAPTIIEHEDGSLYLTIGGAGGPRILPCVFQVIINLDWGLDPRRAIEAGRLHDQLYPQWVDFEPWYSDDLLDGLRQRGHNLTGTPSHCWG
jgi:gamma-glutamyltranspeptidase/glutathione hydrolase/leukotriene-C4 hydrolase